MTLLPGSDHLKEIRSHLKEIGEVQVSLPSQGYEIEKYTLLESRYAILEHAEAMSEENEQLRRRLQGTLQWAYDEMDDDLPEIEGQP